MTKRELNKTIRFQESCRDTHVQWIDHYQKYPGEHRMEITRLVGTVAHHRKLVVGYDKTLKLLRTLA